MLAAVVFINSSWAIHVSLWSRTDFFEVLNNKEFLEVSNSVAQITAGVLVC